MTKRALAGVKAIEYAQFVAGPYCAKLLADLGAEVIKIEPTGVGDEARRRAPFPNDIPHPEKSGLFLYLNTNKLGITLNLETATGRKIFKELIKEADILIEDKLLRTMNKWGLDYKKLSKINPLLIMTSITPFGQTGPYTEYKAYHLNIYHSGALGYLTPRNSPDLSREPLKAGGFVGEYACGLSGAIATLAALYSQRVTGSGQYLDVSKQESLISLQRVHAAYYPNLGINPTRRYQTTGMGGLMRCKDGYVSIIFNQKRQWLALVKLMGNPEWAKDEKYKDMASRIAHYDELEPLISQWMLNHTRDEICYQAQALSLPSGSVLSPEEIVNSEQAKARGFLTEVAHPEAGIFKYPTAPYQFLNTPWAVERPAPRLGEHNEEIYCHRLGYTPEELVKLRGAGVI